MIQYLLITLAALTLADRLAPHNQTLSTTTTESSSDQYSIVYQMKNALRNEETELSTRMADAPIGESQRTLADRLGPHSETSATPTTESSSDQYSIVYQMKNALRNEETELSTRMADAPIGESQRTLADRLGPPSETSATPTTESSSDQYSIVYQMKNALRNEGNKLSNRMADVTVPDAVKTCFINGKKGECIQSWLCDNNDTNIIDVIEWRNADAGQCGDFMMQCCLLRKKEIPTPEIPKGCGWANPRGVWFGFKGHDGETNFAEFPWTVALKQKSGLNLGVGLSIYKVIGGGSLIHPKVVLTAAHYIFRNPADDFKVKAGEWDSHSTNEPYPHQERRVQEVVAHPNYNGVSGAYDSALLFLESPVLLAPHIGLACLAPAGTRAAAGARCIATGWGKTSKENMDLARILKRVEVPVVDRWQCQSMLQRSRLGPHYVLDASVMCAGGDGVDTCKGDGGAPLVCLSSTPDRYVQHGVVSWGIGCNTYPGVYSDVGYMRGWIDDSMRSHHFDPSVYSLDSYQN